MTASEFEAIKHWSLHSHLIEIQSRVESGRILAAALRDGRTNDPKRDANQLAHDLAYTADWIGFVSRDRSTSIKGAPKDEIDVLAQRLLTRLEALEAALLDNAAPDASHEREMRRLEIAKFLREEFGSTGERRG